MASSTQRLKIRLEDRDDDLHGFRGAAGAGVCAGRDVERDLHAAVLGAALRRVVGRDRLGVAPAVGAHARGPDAGCEEPRHRLRARLRQLPVRREAQGADRDVVGVADHVDLPGHAAERIGDAGEEPLVLGADRGLAGLEQPVAQDRDDAPVGAVVDVDEPAPDLLGQERRQPRRGRRPGRHRARRRAGRRCRPRACPRRGSGASSKPR